MSIQIDTREKYLRVVKLFSKIAPDIETTVAKLPLGDYLIENGGKEILIERKTISDYTSHLSDLKDKLYRMRSRYYLSGLLLEGTYKTTTCIVERRGSGNYETIPLSSFHNFLFHQEIQGTILFRTNNIRESVILMSNLHEYLGSLDSHSSPLVSPKPLDILTLLPGIKEKRALEIIKKYGSVGMALSHIKEWASLPGIGKRTVEEVEKFLSTSLSSESESKEEKVDEFRNDWVRLSNEDFRHKYYRGPWANL
jgi:ERCC4-type nuclease